MEFIIIGMGIAIVVLSIVTYNQYKEIKSLEISLDSAIEFGAITSNYSPDEMQEGFIKFLSESRQWAFDYIENLQKDLEIMTNTLVESVANIHTKKRVSKEDKALLDTYYSLISLLPDADK
jgi:alpha-amylase/alpha-mannosidase (GH57 family)